MWWISMTTLALAGPGGAVWSAGDTFELEDLAYVTASPSGQVVVAAASDRVVALDGATGAVRADVELDGGAIRQVDVTDSGLLALSWQGGVTVHQADGREMLRVGGYTGRVKDLALAADGLHVAVATAEGVFLHAVPGGGLVWSSDVGRDEVAFHPAGTQVYAASETNNVVLSRDSGKELARFGVTPAHRFTWAGDQLWSRSSEEAPRPYSTDALAPLDPLDAPASTVWAVDDLGHAAVDSCRIDVESGAHWCIGVDAVGAALGPDGSLWLGTASGMEHWRELPAGAATAAGGAGGAAVAVAVGPDGQVMESGSDGLVTLRSADGAPLWGVQPSCSADPCLPLGMGVGSDQAWWLGPDGLAWSWTIDGGGPVLAGQATNGSGGGRMDDGRWAVRVGSKARVGSKPGKGGGPLVPGFGLVVGPDGFATLGAVAWFGPDGTPHGALKLGPGRTARHVSLAHDDSSLVLIDDQGAVHRYLPSGRAAYRRPTALDEVEGLAVLTDGTAVVAETTSLRFLDPASGDDMLRVVLAGDGPAAIAGRDALVVAWSTDGATAVWRIDPADLTRGTHLEPEPEPDPPTADSVPGGDEDG